MTFCTVFNSVACSWNLVGLVNISGIVLAKTVCIINVALKMSRFLMCFKFGDIFTLKGDSILVKKVTKIVAYILELFVCVCHVYTHYNICVYCVLLYYMLL